MMKYIRMYTVCLAALGAWGALAAQNTIGGEAKIVPEEEVNRQSLFIDAERERLLEHYEKAVERYKQFLYENGANAAAWYGLARTFEAQNDNVNALDAAAKAVAADPTNRWYLIFQGDLLEKVGQAPDALKIYQELVRRFPNTAEFYERLAYLSVLTGDPKGGLKALDQMEKILGITEVTADKKHVIYLGMGDTKKAAAELEKLANAYPRHLEYRHRLAEFYESVGDKANARKVYEAILRQNPGDEVAKIAVLEKSGSELAFLNSLKPYFKDPAISLDGKIRELLPYFDKLAQGMDPASVQALLDLGMLLETAHPDDPKAWSLSGDLFYHSDSPREALLRYQQCIRLQPAVFSVWENTLTILYEQKNFDELLRVSERAMDDFPNQAAAYYYYGVAATEKGRPDDALPQLEQATLMAGNKLPLLLDIQDQIGRALLAKKDFAGAKVRYEQILSKSMEKHPGILEHYGDALFHTGNREKAAEFWQKAYKIAPTPALEQKISTGKI
ncbi:MAG: tetratricopeptide repeat protein [Saprospirales bacterium]|nr:tetratricopeptide repeat protein [Saprospirales bacterium]MBK8922938.1 tetratricopeptide repeat protein [Saprospirales bacterium]